MLRPPIRRVMSLMRCLNATSALGAAATIRALLLPRQPPLQVAHPPLLARSHAHPVEALPVAGRHRHYHSTVDTHGRQAVGSRRCAMIFDTEGDVPVAAVTLNGDVAHLTTQFTAEPKTNPAQLG